MGSISVVTPNFNYSKFSPRAVESVLNQTHSDEEIIIVDDGSIDDSWEVIRKFLNIVIAIFQENIGLGGARNIGILSARGDYEGLLDADDDRCLPIWKQCYA